MLRIRYVSLSLSLICIISPACTLCSFPLADPLQIKGKGKRKIQITGNELKSCCDVRLGLAAVTQCTYYVILFWSIRKYAQYASAICIHAMHLEEIEHIFLKRDFDDHKKYTECTVGLN